MENEVTRSLLRLCLPEFDWILREMEKSDGWLNLPTSLIDVIFRMDLRWYDAYEEPKRFALYQMLMLVDLDTIKDIQTKEEAETLKAALQDEVYSILRSPEIQELKPYSEEDKLR